MSAVPQTTHTASLHDLQHARSAGLPATTGLPTARDVAVMPGFNSAQSWDLAQRIGKAFAASTLVPQQYQGNLANCIVALEMANRMGASPLMVMQNLYIVHGNPGWSSKFLVASFNQCGRFSALRYEFTGQPGTKQHGCRAWAIEKVTGEKLIGATITVQMAEEEGWSKKPGSKWKTMPEQMLMYRAAAFFVRVYAPEISMGLRSVDEIEDGVIDAQPGSITTIGELQEHGSGGTGSPVIDPADRPDAGTVVLTKDQVLEAIYAATTTDQLDAARAHIEHLSDAMEQAECNAAAAKQLQVISSGK